MLIDGDCNAIDSLGSSGIKDILTIENLRASGYITGHAKNNTSVTEHFQISPTIEKLKIHISDCFDDNKEINDLLELFMKEFWLPLYRRMIPTLMDVVDTRVTNLCNIIFSKLPIFQIFH